MPHYAAHMAGETAKARKSLWRGRTAPDESRTRSARDARPTRV